ncbi:MAG: SHOCT domain-containing protein [Chloroflexota bacterium]
MWRSRQFILVVAVAAVVVLGSLGGIALAQTGSDNGSQPADQRANLWERALEIYQQKTGDTIDQTALQDALTQARSEWQAQAKQDMSQRLDQLLADGKITQDQYDRMKSRLEAAPGTQPEPNGTPGFGFRGFGGFRDMGRMHGWGGPGAPTQPPAPTQ